MPMTEVAAQIDSVAAETGYMILPIERRLPE